MSEIKLIKDNVYPTSVYKRIKMKDVKEAKTFWLYSNGKETEFEVLTHYDKDINKGGNGRVYSLTNIPKKYQNVFQEMNTFMENKI